jgi:hypothetical protein
LSIAVVNVETPSCSGFTLVSASSEDLSAATSAHASVPAPDGEAELDAAVVDAAVAAGELASLGAELPPQLVRAHSRATAATALDGNRRAERNRICLLLKARWNLSRYTRTRPQGGELIERAIQSSSGCSSGR